MFSWLKTTKQPRAVAKRLRIRPMLEVLENRSVPTVNLSTNFAGMNIGDTAGFTPPDTDAAAGPAHIVETVNSSLAIYSKAGTQLSIQSLNSLFGAGGPDVFDPVVTYDDIAGRFIVAALQVDDGTLTSSLWVAVSNSSDPTAGFSEIHQINIKESSGGTDFWGDYPKIGWNADAVVVTVNMFSFPTTTGTFDHVQVISMESSSLFDQSSFTLVSFQVDRPVGINFTMAAASMHGAVAGDPMYFVTNNFVPGTIEVLTMTNVLSAAPTFTSTPLAANAYTDPPSAVQPGGTITTNDSRVLNAEWRNNRLVASQTVGIGTVAAARWYEFDTSAVPSLIQQGDILPGAGISTFMPAISIAPNGSLGMSYMQSSATEFISMYIVGRAPSTPAGTMQAPVLAKAGEAFYAGQDRSGDYSGISIDPVDGSFWAANEYASNAFALDNWGTWIANFSIFSVVPTGSGPVYRPLRFVFSSPPFGNAPAPGYRGAITLYNSTTTAFSGPITFLFSQLPANVTLTNPTGYTSSGVPFITIPGPVNAGNHALVNIQLQDPDDESLGTYFIGFPVLVINGPFDPTLV